MHGKPKSISKRSDIRVAVAAEAGRTIALARRVGKRLRLELNKNKGVIPNAEWLETAKWQTRAIAELGRLVIADEIGGPNADKDLTAAEYAEEISIIAREYIAKLSPDELRTLLAASGITDPANPAAHETLQ